MVAPARDVPEEGGAGSEDIVIGLKAMPIFTEDCTVH